MLADVVISGGTGITILVVAVLILVGLVAIKMLVR